VDVNLLIGSNTLERPIITNGNEFQKQASLLTGSRIKMDVLGAKLDKEELRKTNIDISVMALDWH